MPIDYLGITFVNCQSILSLVLTFEKTYLLLLFAFIFVISV